MKIHSICIVKNEGDVIEQNLIAALQWSDFIYVFDNGSTDGTWEKVLAMAQQFQQIVCYKQEACWFHYGLRCEVFNHYRSRSQDNDWWCRLDADEFYIDNPRTFLSQVPHQYQWVWGTSLEYYFTDRDLERYEENPDLYGDDVPVEKKLRYYLNDWSEARFFRYDSRLIWDLHRPWPYLGAAYPERIRLKHFQYRSPQQIQSRLNTRLKIANAGGSFRHEARWVNSRLSTNRTTSRTSNAASSQSTTLAIDTSLDEDFWKVRVMDSVGLNYDAGDGNYIVQEEGMKPLPSNFPRLRNWLRPLKMVVLRLKR